MPPRRKNKKQQANQQEAETNRDQEQENQEVNNNIENDITSDQTLESKQSEQVQESNDPKVHTNEQQETQQEQHKSPENQHHELPQSELQEQFGYEEANHNVEVTNASDKLDESTTQANNVEQEQVNKYFDKKRSFIKQQCKDVEFDHTKQVDHTVVDGTHQDEHAKQTNGVIEQHENIENPVVETSHHAVPQQHVEVTEEISTQEQKPEPSGAHQQDTTPTKEEVTVTTHNRQPEQFEEVTEESTTQEQKPEPSGAHEQDNHEKINTTTNEVIVTHNRQPEQFEEVTEERTTQDQKPEPSGAHQQETTPMKEEVIVTTNRQPEQFEEVTEESTTQEQKPEPSGAHQQETTPMKEEVIVTTNRQPEQFEEVTEERTTQEQKPEQSGAHPQDNHEITTTVAEEQTVTHTKQQQQFEENNEESVAQVQKPEKSGEDTHEQTTHIKSAEQQVIEESIVQEQKPEESGQQPHHESPTPIVVECGKPQAAPQIVPEECNLPTPIEVQQPPQDIYEVKPTLTFDTPTAGNDSERGQFETGSEKINDNTSNSQKTKAQSVENSNSTDPREVQLRQYQQSLDEGLFLKNQGNQQFQQQKYAEAITHYTSATGLCQQYYLMQCPPELLPQFHSLNLTLMNNLSACYLNMGLNQECITFCNQVISMNPTNAKAFFRRACAYQKKEDFEEAYEDINKAWEIVKDSTQDKMIFDKRREIREQFKQYNSLHKSKHQEMYKKMFNSEKEALPSEIQPKQPEIVVNRREQQSSLNYTEIVVKTTASALLASTITKFILEDALESQKGILETLLLSSGLMSAAFVKKTWQRLSFGTVTAGLIAYVLYRKGKK